MTLYTNHHNGQQVRSKLWANHDKLLSFNPDPYKNIRKENDLYYYSEKNSLSYYISLTGKFLYSMLMLEAQVSVT